MPYGYNSLNDFKLDLQEIGMCPICSVRLTHGCEHSQTQESQEWLAAVIVAEQELANEKYNFVHPIDAAQEIEQDIDAKLSVSLFSELAEQHNRRASAIAKVNPADCKHEREHPQHNGWACNACHRVREAEGDFEKRQVSRLNYKGNGYVNYRMR